MDVICEKQGGVILGAQLRTQQRKNAFAHISSTAKNENTVAATLTTVTRVYFLNVDPSRSEPDQPNGQHGHAD